MIKPWTDLTPREKLMVIEQIADPGFTWTTRAGLVYEYLRIKWLEQK